MQKDIQGVEFSKNKEKNCGAPTSLSMSNSTRAQRFDPALSKSKNKKNMMDFDSISNIKIKHYVLKDKKKSPRRVLKIFGASGLAVFMGIGALLGLLIVPINSADAGTQARLGGEDLNGVAGLSSGGAGSLGYGDNGASGGEAVVLDPKSDETIFTTESGFEIKSHNVSGQTLANSKVQYFTLGEYEGNPINWIILATSTQMAENNTDAGIAINGANENGYISMITDSKLSANQVLVVSEKVISSYMFAITEHTNATGSLPASVTNGSGWAKGNSSANVNYYATLLVDQAEDFYSSYTFDPSSAINDLYANNSFMLSDYYDNAIIKNSNFNESYYGFAFTYNQWNTYLPANVSAAVDFSGTQKEYWLGDPVNFTFNTASISTFAAAKPGSGIVASFWSTCYGCSGSRIMTWSLNSVDTVGTFKLVEGKITANISYKTGTGNYWGGNTATAMPTNLVGMYPPTCSYSADLISAEAYLRPAMVVDLSKF